MARRGFFAELQHQGRVAQREQERREREAQRSYAVAMREVERSRAAAERAHAQFERAQAAERKRLKKEARDAHLAAQEAEVAARNEALAETLAEIESLLAATLGRDDFVDLKQLRVRAEHPPFARTDADHPLAPPKGPPDPPRPALKLPEEPRGFASLFGKRKHIQAVEEAQRAHEQAVADWKVQCRLAAERREREAAEHARAEECRLRERARERAFYDEECAAREAEAEARNASLEEFITNLGYGTAEAIQEYVSIVLSNSVYPDHFPVGHEFEFDAGTAELSLRVTVPEPSALPEVKAFRYAKATDEIVASEMPQKERRERYAGAVHQVALRSIHEVFESDRRGLIRTIALELGTDAADPATGKRGFIPFVIAAAEREAFMSFDLSAVVPAMTLARMGAAVSKNPYALVPVERRGVRRT